MKARELIEALQKLPLSTPQEALNMLQDLAKPCGHIEELEREIWNELERKPPGARFEPSPELLKARALIERGRICVLITGTAYAEESITFAGAIAYADHRTLTVDLDLSPDLNLEDPVHVDHLAKLARVHSRTPKRAGSHVLVILLNS